MTPEQTRLNETVERAAVALAEFGEYLRAAAAVITEALGPVLQQWSDREGATHEGRPCPLGLEHETAGGTA